LWRRLSERGREEIKAKAQRFCMLTAESAFLLLRRAILESH
jgi:hypothetical protein